MTKLKLALTIAALTTTCTAFANPIDYGDGAENFSSPDYLKNKDGKFNYWKGIGKLSGPLGNCTTFVIDTHSKLDSDPVYALTSAHCLNKKNGVIDIDKPIEGTITFNYFDDTTDAYKNFPVKKVVWSSIQGIDLGILELDTTQGELKAAGVAPLKLASEAPAEDTDILIVNAASGYPLKAAACTHHSSSALFEKPWVWRHSVRNQCKGIVGGSSGSPVLIRATNEVYAVLGTRAKDVTRLPGYDYVESSNYGSPTAILNDCVVDGRINTDPNTCQLYPTASLPLPSDIIQYAKIAIETDGKPLMPTWNFPINVSTRHYRYKQTYIPLDCEKPDGYSPSIDGINALVDVSMGPQPGLNNLCIIGTDSLDNPLPAGTYRNAVTVPTYLHAAGPTPAPELVIFFDKKVNRVSIEWPVRKNEGIDLYQRKYGKPEQTNCDDPQGYTDVTFNMSRGERDMPLKVCTYAHDTNKQRSAVHEYILEWEALTGTAP
ncbi:trypsin-like peptidase domain-containing protein [Pseudomonas sp. AL03]|uniref:trypsin-like peptidase domain-containing protein n=1 Tax=Pseudomonas sp. AL03 TaxID=3042230 RepID=UPI00249B777D|nr:trypsin-like peptidase domain-containing protein [Pseudomonas sp. AL03]MDI3272878.1 trypsin-like peptidase domain-containing protein [Pseudomonas sp. AL03]